MKKRFLIFKTMPKSGEDILSFMTNTDSASINAAEASILSAIESNPSLLNDTEIKAVYDNAKKSGVSSTTSAMVQQNPYSDITPAVQTPATKQNQTQDSTSEYTGGLFFPDDVQIDTNNITPEMLPTSLGFVGIKADSPDWAKDLISKLQAYKEQEEQLVEYKDKVDRIQEDFQRLPNPLLLAIRESLNGNDWRQSVRENDIDYSQSFDSLSDEDKVRVTKKLLPDIEVNGENDALKKAAISLGKNAFDSVKKSMEAELERIKADNEIMSKNYSDSVVSSLDELKSKYKEFADERRIAKIKKALESRDVVNMFYDAKGNARKDAAEKLALVLYGDTIIKRISNKNAARIANEQVANIITAQQTKGAGANGITNINKEDREAELEMFGQKMLDTYKSVY